MIDLELLESSYKGVTKAMLNSRPFLNILLSQQGQWGSSANIWPRDIEMFEVLHQDEIEDYLVGRKTAELTSVFLGAGVTGAAVGHAAGNLRRKIAGHQTAFEMTIRITTKDKNWCVFKIHEKYAKRLAGKLSFWQIKADAIKDF